MTGAELDRMFQDFGRKPKEDPKNAPHPSKGREQPCDVDRTRVQVGSPFEEPRVRRPHS
jgi:hypothetical protein